MRSSAQSPVITQKRPNQYRLSGLAALSEVDSPSAELELARRTRAVLEEESGLHRRGHDAEHLAGLTIQRGYGNW